MKVVIVLHARPMRKFAREGQDPITSVAAIKGLKCLNACSVDRDDHDSASKHETIVVELLDREKTSSSRSLSLCSHRKSRYSLV